jgi:hypothetical protein
LIWLSIESRSIAFGFSDSVRNLKPKNWSQRIQPKHPHSHRDVSVQWHDAMTALPSRNANIADYAANPTAWDKNARTFSPDFVKFAQKVAVVCNLSELSFILLVFL